MTFSARFLVLSMLAACPPTFCQGERRTPRVRFSESIHSGDSLLQVDFGEGAFDLPDSRIVQRVQNVADAIGHFYGRFPVARTRILILPVAGRHGVLQGTTWGNRDGFSAFLRIGIGSATTPEELKDDWILTHELVHTALASLPNDQSWLEEGVASYIEPFIRMETGEISQETMWAGMVRGMPNGQPEGNDKGLNHTHTWGRTYWGGALFCLTADIQIRRQTGNLMGLPDALRAIVAAHATIDIETPVERVLAIGDVATKTHVLQDLYKQWGESSVAVDLPGLWNDLGVQLSGRTVTLNPRAPHALVRVAMTAARQTKPQGTVGRSTETVSPFASNVVTNR